MEIIPKKIHYFWFGHNQKPEIVQKCIESWNKYMPDYEVIEWNEDNYNIHKCKYMRQAYENKKWAFVSDYARFDILYQYGGIYLDTDVELLKPIPVEILQSGNAVTGMESTGRVAPGLIFATWPRHRFCKAMLDSYERDEFIVEGEQNLLTVNKRVCNILDNEGFSSNNQMQTIMHIDIYPSEYFCGYNLDLREYEITDKTVSIHHYASTWKKKGIKRRLQTIIKNTIGNKGYRAILQIKRKLFGVYDK